MTASNEKTTRAILLRAVSYGDTDRVVTFLTEDYGKRSLFAVGARKSSKRFAGALEPFREIRIRFREPRNEGLARLMGAHVLEGFDAIAHELHTLYWASLTSEWAAELCAERQNAPIFDSMLKLMAWLDAQKRGAWFTEVGCMRFAMVLLAYAGFLPSLDRSARSGAPKEEIESLVFSKCGGGLLSADEARPDDQAVPVTRASANFLTEVAKGRFPAMRELEILRESRRLVFDLLHSVIEKEPKSLSLVQTVWL